MRRTMTLLAAGALALSAVACAPTYEVRTMAAPGTRLSELHTFRVLPVPRPRDGRAAGGAYDPMVDNSIANRALREAITTAFQDRGYVVDERTPDFAVAVYASAHERLDVTEWDYGYPYWPWRRGYGRAGDRVSTYTEGTVVVDVVDGRSRELLWRGTGSARLSEDPVADTKELQKVARAIVMKVPVEVPRAVAERR